jgi:regulator of protease activity HflC (stomatin/prohibitin superfamily)
MSDSTAIALPAPPPGPPPKTPKKRPLRQRMAEGYARWASRWGPLFFITAIFALIVSIIYFDRMFIFIHSGRQGVLWHRFTGTDLEHHYTEGMTTIWPWDYMYIYDVRAQQVSDSFPVISRDGLTVNIEVSIRYKPEKERLALLHVEVGPNYVEKVVKPEIRAKVRYLMGQYLPEEIYSSQGLLVRRMEEDAAPELAERHITLEDLLIKTITLPPQVQAAINAKMAQQQAYLEYEFRLKRETAEKERKQIEAEGIQKFETIIQSGGSSFDKYLTYLGVQATLALAQSDNAKVVIIGGDKGLPLILNTSDTNTPGGPKAAVLPPNDGTPFSALRPAPGPAKEANAPLPEPLSQSVENPKRGQ